VSYFWVPVIGTGASPKDAQRANVPTGTAFRYALPIQINKTTGKATVTTVPISVADGVSVSTSVAAPPSADAALYSTALVAQVARKILTRDQAEALATALGLQLGGTTTA
jgi:hypothetical protein